MVEVELDIEMVLVRQGIEVVGVEQDLMVEVQLDIDEREIVVVVVGVKHIVEMDVAEC